MEHGGLASYSLFKYGTQLLHGISHLLSKIPWIEVVISSFNAINMHLGEYHSCPTQMKANSVQSIWQIIVRVLGSTMLSTRVGHTLHRPVNANNWGDYHPSKITNLLPHLIVNEPQGKTVQQHQHHGLQHKAMLNELPLFNSEMVLRVVVHGHDKKSKRINSKSSIFWFMIACKPLKSEQRLLSI